LAGKFGVLGQLVQAEDVAMAGLPKKQSGYQVQQASKKKNEA
jgi:hypothetical protein